MLDKSLIGPYSSHMQEQGPKITAIADALAALDMQRVKDNQKVANLFVDLLAEINEMRADLVRALDFAYTIATSHDCGAEINDQALSLCAKFEQYRQGHPRRERSHEMKKNAERCWIRRLVRWICEPDRPSLAWHLEVPRWKSCLIDWGRLLTFGLWKP